MWTKEYRNEYMKKYQRENREQINANARRRYQKNRDAILERQKEYQKSYYQKKKLDPEYMEKMRERVRRYREANREKIREYDRMYHKIKYAEKRQDS